MSDTDIAFENFLAQVDPQRVERERLGTVTGAERPGSYSDRVMRLWHDVCVEEFHARAKWREALLRQDASAFQTERYRQHQAWLHPNESIQATGLVERKEAGGF